MKKITFFLCSLALVFSLLGVAGASSILYTQSLDEAIIEGFKEPFLLVDSFSKVTENIIGDATLEISGDEIDSDQNEGAVLEKVVANLTTGGYLGSYFISSTDLFSFDNPAFRSFNKKPTRIYGNGRGSNSYGSGSNDYGRGSNSYGRDSNGNGVAPVPEPSTMLLLGAGLLGLVAIGRRKFNPEQ